jgi:hypothetical protein
VLNLNGVGGKCGSTYIDRNFYQRLSERFGLAFDNVPHARKAPGSRFMNEFEKLKMQFGSRDYLGPQEIGPINLMIPTNSHYDAENQAVKLTQ